MNRRVSLKSWSLVVALAILLPCSLAWAGPKAESAKIKDIRKLMKITGAAELGMQVMDQMMMAFRQNMPKVPKTFWDEFSKKVNPQQLVDMVVPIYDKHLTHADIKNLVKFYETPTGKKIIRVLPRITQESMAAGEAWGRQIGQQVITELKAKGYR